MSKFKFSHFDIWRTYFAFASDDHEMVGTGDCALKEEASRMNFVL